MFYTVLRVRIRNTGEYITNAGKYDSYEAALRQFFNLTYTDMGDATLQYHAVHVIDNTGLMVEGRVFDHREQEASNEE